MTSFYDTLVEGFSKRVEAIEAPTVGDILGAIRSCCEAVELEDREDVESYSVMAEVGELDGEHLFLLSLHFDLNRSPDGQPADIRGSLECEFRLDGPLSDRPAHVEFDEMLHLDEIFSAVADWPPYLAVKDRSLPLTWEAPDIRGG
ncbi:MAG: hypothetical protein RIC55_00020 [Pirellulaceae bacterium]